MKRIPALVAVAALVWTALVATAVAASVRPAAGLAYKAAVLADHPSAYWRVDEAVGPNAADSSGNAITGTYGTIGAYQRTGALLNDSDTAIAAGTGSALTAPAASLPGDATARTVEFWTATSGCCSTAAVTWGDLAGGHGFQASYSYSSGTLRVTDGQSGNAVALGQPFDLDDGNWHLLDFTFAAGTVIVYVDGVAAGSGPLAAVDTAVTGSVTVGSGGSLDEVAIYPSALSSARVATHWTSGSSQAASCAAKPTGAYPAAVLADRPAGYFRADDIITNPRGRVAYDASGNCHNGANRYSTVSTNGALVGDPDSAISGSFTAPSTSLPKAARARTVEFWASSSGCCAQLGVSYGDYGAGRGFYVGYRYSAGQLLVGDGSTAGQYALTLGQPYDLDDGRWHLYDLTYSAGALIFYVDGVAVGRGTLPGLNTDTTLGLTANGPAIDEVSVFPAALSAARIATHWTAGSSALAACAGTPSGPYPGAVLADTPSAYYRLDDIATNSKGRVAYDSSGQCANGSLRYTDRTAAGALVSDRNSGLAGGFAAPAGGLPAGAAARTIEFWGTSAGCCGTYGVGYGDVGSANGFRVTVQYSAGIVSMDDGQADFSQLAVNQPFDLDDGRWHLFDATLANGAATLYVDGVAVATGSMAGLTTDTGIGLTGSARTLDEVAVYPSALSAARVAAHWTAGSSALAACAPTPTGAYPTSVLADSPTEYYRLADIAASAKGRIAYDASGRCANGALRYTDTSTTGAITADNDTAIAGSFTAPGAGLPAGGTARTIEFWTRTSGCCGTAGVTYGDYANGNGFAVVYQYSANVLTVNDGSSSIAQVSVSAGSIDDGQWHLIDLVYTGTRATFYVDGTSVGGGPLASLTTDAAIGLTAYSQSVDEVAVYPAALGAGRVGAHWNASGHA